MVPGRGGLFPSAAAGNSCPDRREAGRSPPELKAVLTWVRAMSDGATRVSNSQPFPLAPVPSRGAGRLLGLLKDVPKATHLCYRVEKCVFPSQLSRHIPANPNSSQEEVSGMHWQGQWGGQQPFLQGG